MLEFQEGFFEQETREGFYIDKSMKAAWAAGMEVLQKVAEICDRYDIAWYAAYGTLLGAIRHGGYVPWDEDLDIWVKREGYNKLVQILPKELPEGYRVKSPLTAEGFRHFHMLVQNSDHMHLEKEWLEQYHGCPFSVGVDIFPLDYLPRKEEEQVAQEKMVSIATRGAQLAYYIDDAVYENPENPTEEKKAYVEEIWEAIQYLEVSCGAKISGQLVIEEKWSELASEFSKWANYIAMLYGEEESDYLVNFIDYVRWPRKKFPKEWFAETYSATFENFMLPIPCEYDQLLRNIYGNYKVRVKNTGQHDYPYYVKQLRQLGKAYREQVNWPELPELSVSLDAIMTGEEDVSLPPAWESIVVKEGERRKKIVLFVNDISVFLAYPEKALDKLEKVLSTFEAAQHETALWWRPQKNMAERMKGVSPELAERYQAILDSYKSAGWGICDETNNVDRAVEQCDAYYGNMNAILQPFQNTKKPIMIQNVEV